MKERDHRDDVTPHDVLGRPGGARAVPAPAAGPGVRITVLEVLQGGAAPCGYRPGDSWLVADLHAPEGMCTWALSAMAPFLAVLRFGGVLPWESDPDSTTVCCPDPANPVVFELRRVNRARGGAEE